MAETAARAHGAPEATSVSRGRYVRNVLWNLLGTAGSFFFGVILNPYMVRKLGDERYGIWALAFTLIDYFDLFALGFNTAVINFVARFRVRQETNRINEAVNTSLLYFSAVGVVLLTVTMLLSTRLHQVFQISPAYRRDFSILIAVTGVTWAVGMVFEVFRGCLESSQRYDLINYAWIAAMAPRVVGCFVLLAMGYGLLAMGFMVILSLALRYAINFHNFRRVFPEFRFSGALVNPAMWKEMMAYGLHSLVAHISQLVVNQSAPLMIGHFRPAAYVGYYTLPGRLLQYSVDAVSRVALVTGSNVAQLSAMGRSESVLVLATFSNRYCLTMFMPLLVYLTVWGTALLGVWITPNFALQSGPLIPVMGLATAFATGAQLNSSATLFGLARHQQYARGLLVEAVLTIAVLPVVIPRYGIIGAAWTSSILMILNRGIYTPWLLCRVLKQEFLPFMTSIYLRPTLVGLGTLLLCHLVKKQGLIGRTWTELAAGALLCGCVYAAAAYFVCLEPEHRRAVTTLAMRPLRWFA